MIELFATMNVQDSN